MFIIWTCVWLLQLWSSGHVRVYALRESKLCLPISAGLKAASIMHEDQYAVALWVRPCNSVPISSIPANCPAVWRDPFGFIRAQGKADCYCYLLLFEKNNACSAVFGVFLTFAVLWQDLMVTFSEAFYRDQYYRGISSKIHHLFLWFLCVAFFGSHAQYQHILIILSPKVFARYKCSYCCKCKFKEE